MSAVDELKAKIAKLSEEENKSFPHIAGMNRSYAILDVLDRKASGLMTVNAFLGAILAFSINHRASTPAAFGWNPVIFKIAAEALVVALLASASLCFLVVRVQWPFLHNVKKDGGDGYCVLELDKLAEVIVNRTKRYRWAWRITIVCLIVLVGLASIYIWA